MLLVKDIGPRPYEGKIFFGLPSSNLRAALSNNLGLVLMRVGDLISMDALLPLW